MKQITFTKRIRKGHSVKESFVVTIPKRDVVDPLQLKDGSIVEINIKVLK